ncbi:MAG: hypothetical protein NTW65_08560 [Deltaproteobacteria bacterium]|nr:hypothetical protein [Deltaproteobacteria bacterium]
MGRIQQRLTNILFLSGACVIIAASTFTILYWHSSITTPGPAVLNLGHKNIGHAVLQLPAGWRVRPNGVDKWKQCAVLIDPTSVPRLMVCAFGYPAGSEKHPGSLDDAASFAKRLAGNRRNADESVTSDAHQTAVGVIYEVARTYRTSASYYVVTSGTVSEHEFVRTAGPYLLLLRIYEDAAQRAALNPIAFELAERAEIR